LFNLQNHRPKGKTVAWGGDLTFFSGKQAPLEAGDVRRGFFPALSPLHTV